MVVPNSDNKLSDSKFQVNKQSYCSSKASNHAKKDASKTDLSKKQFLTNGSEALNRSSSAHVERLKNYVVASNSKAWTGNDITPELLEWEQRKSQLVYNFQDQTLNPARLRATSYKFNKQTTLPQADSAESEMKHEVRKQELLKVFSDTLKPHGSKKIPSLASRSNLSQLEVEGLKSLRKRISAKELVVC